MVLSAPVSVIQDITGVVPLLFLSAVPFNSPIVQARFLEVWFMIAVLYFALGFLMLIVSYRRLDEPQKRRRVGMLCVAVGIFEVVTIHNILMRNWGSWFGTAPPVFFSGVASIGAIAVFLSVPLTLAYCVLADKPFGQAR